MTQITEDLAIVVGVKRACEVLDVPRSRIYRSRQPQIEPRERPIPARALSQSERMKVRDTLNSERFADLAPRQVYAKLLDEQQYLCHWRTMYRILNEHDEVRERRDQRRHPIYQKPELLATAPNQVWSWDITKLRSPHKGTYFALYAVLDIFSRYAVGWMIAERELASLAKTLIEESCQKEGIEKEQLTIHSDNGKPMRSKSLALLYADLGVNASFNRPYTSDDNAFSEAQFKTLKYQPDYPDRFGSIQDARVWARRFFNWYNYEHYHTGLNLLTPASVHRGEAIEVQQQRQAILTLAFAAHPERFVKGAPLVAGPPQAVWINPPKEVKLP
jgi:putative transposase